MPDFGWREWPSGQQVEADVLAEAGGRLVAEHRDADAAATVAETEERAEAGRPAHVPDHFAAWIGR